MSDSCWFIKPSPAVKVTVIYIHPTIHDGFQDLARRFVQTYEQFPAGYPHRTIVICNGGQISPVGRMIFSPIASAEFIPHDNTAMDIGGFQFSARTFPCELMVFFGASTYFRKPNWLKRMVEAYQKHGEGLYGASANRGVQGHCFPHIRTTAFWCKPDLMNSYPHKITRADQRYAFEHSKQNLTAWAASEGYPTLVVSTDGEYAWGDWDSFPGGYHRNMQEALLCGDRLTCPPYFPFA